MFVVCSLSARTVSQPSWSFDSHDLAKLLAIRVRQTRSKLQTTQRMASFFLLKTCPSAIHTNSTVVGSSIVPALGGTSSEIMELSSMLECLPFRFHSSSSLWLTTLLSSLSERIR